jgi:hypothetical protein
MAKKIFYFSLGFFILVLIFWGAYNFAFKNNVNSPVADPNKKEFEKENQDTAVLGSDALSNPLNENILGSTVDEGGSLYYYSLDDQALKKATLEGRNKTILMSNLPGTATRVLWSPKKDKALLFLKQTSGGMLWYEANIATKSLVPLKPEMSRLSWDNLGEKIFYQYTDPATQKRSLNIANSDGSGWKKLADLGAKDFFLASVPQSSLVSFWARPLAREKSPLETISTVGENRQVLSGEFFGADYLWAPNGENVIVSGSANPQGALSLAVMSHNGGSAKNLSIPTLTSKTTWSKDNRTLYYALPGALPEGAVLPDDYFSKPLYTKDTFWKMDITTGKKTRLIELSENTQALDSTDLFLSPDEDFLYFTDRVSKKLYRIEL